MIAGNDSKGMIQIIYKVKNLCFLYEKLSYPQSGFIPQAGKPVFSFVEENVEGKAGAA